MGRVDSRRRWIRRGSRSADHPYGAAQRSRRASGSHARCGGDFPARRVIAACRDGRMGAHPLPHDLAARALPRVPRVGAVPGSAHECGTRGPGRNPRARCPADSGRLLRVCRRTPYGRQCLRCRGRADQSTRRERGLRGSGRPRPGLLCPMDSAPERRGAHVALAPTEHRRPARGCGRRSYLLEHSCSPVGVGGPDLDDRWGPRVHSRVLVARFPWNAGCSPEHARSDRFRRPRWRCRTPCSPGRRASSHDRPRDRAERRARRRAVWVGSLARRGRTRWCPRRLSLDIPRLLGVLRTAPARR